MSAECGAAHPQRPEVGCTKPVPCYGNHTHAVLRLSWPGNPAPGRISKGGNPGRLLEIAKRARMNR